MLWLGMAEQLPAGPVVAKGEGGDASEHDSGRALTNREALSWREDGDSGRAQTNREAVSFKTPREGGDESKHDSGRALGYREALSWKDDDSGQALTDREALS